jgi:hypothetical protein
MRSIGHYIRESKLPRLVGGAALGLALVLGTGVPAADAQDYNNRPDRRLTRADIRQVATVNGYSDGFEHGTVDRRDRARANFRDSGEYRNATSGYESEWGMRREYQNDYREGYAKGYQDAFYGRARNRDFDRSRVRVYDYRNSPYDPYSSFPSYRRTPYSSAPTYDNSEGDKDRDEVAQAGAQNGYRAGFERGVYDARQNNRANPQGHGSYQFGFDGFVPEWGSASTYQQYYRSYFVQGYEDGYNRRSSNFRYRRF